MVGPSVIGRARQGDAAALASTIASTRPRLVAIAYGILHDHDLADEAAQRALIGIWQHLRSPGDRPFRGTGPRTSSVSEVRWAAG
jgi:DNA-directed RNA polymerase specialized sigma24 family protein